jgi:hypothetical protein
MLGLGKGILDDWIKEHYRDRALRGLEGNCSWIGQGGADLVVIVRFGAGKQSS